MTEEQQKPHQKSKKKRSSDKSIKRAEIIAWRRRDSRNAEEERQENGNEVEMKKWHAFRKSPRVIDKRLPGTSAIYHKYKRYASTKGGQAAIQ